MTSSVFRFIFVSTHFFNYIFSPWRADPADDSFIPAGNKRRHFSTQQQFSMDQRIQNKLTNSILRKWRKQKSFIRFLDGDTRNCRVDNLAYVSLEDAMHHIEAWRVDWDMNLSRAEVALVFDDVWRAGLRF